MVRSQYFNFILALFIASSTAVMPQTFIPQSVTDQTPTAPLPNPSPGSFEPRYMSGLGSSNSFSLFFEDRTTGGPDRFPIAFVSSTTGPTGLSTACTSTDISDTHFLIKAWSITYKGTEYAYRAWGSHGNDRQHEFYVSNDLTHWVTACDSFTIPNASGFHPAGYVYYGFHDVIQINGTYYAFGESNNSETFLVRSANADSVWESFAMVGGARYFQGNLQERDSTLSGWKPTGNFIDLGYDRGYGKIYEDPAYQYLYLAINTAAKASLPPADLEAAFINPANWTWHNGSKGKASSPILSKTSEHNYKECWVVPPSGPNADWTIMYIGDFGSSDGSNALGYATLKPPAVSVKTKLKIWLEGAYQTGGSMRTDLRAGGYIPSISPYADARDAGTVPNGVVDWVYVQLRESETGPAVAERSFFLKSDGTVTETDGAATDLTLTGTGAGSYFIVVRHRNHLAVMSKTAQDLGTGSPSLYDFSTDAAMFYNDDAKLLETGTYGAYAGDANSTGTVDANDRSAAWNDRNKTGYETSDCNLSGTVDANDRSITWNNRNKTTSIP
jgi:hypothetical protein